MFLSFRVTKGILYVNKFNLSVDSLESLFLNVIIVFEDFIFEGREFNIKNPLKSMVCCLI